MALAYKKTETYLTFSSTVTPSIRSKTPQVWLNNKKVSILQGYQEIQFLHEATKTVFILVLIIQSSLFSLVKLESTESCSQQG